MKLTALFVVCAMLFAACSESTAPEYSAEKMSLQSLNTTLGYEWFPAEVAAYKPDTAKLQEIKQAYNPETDVFYLYVNPSCSCKGTQKLFPHTMRILNDAAVQESRFEIYSMRTTSDKHPHMGEMTVKRLPTVFIVRNGNVIGSFSEQPNDSEIEDLLLNALKTN